MNKEPLAIPTSEDEPDVRSKYRPFLSSNTSSNDWVADLELSTAENMVRESLTLHSQRRLRFLVLYGSLRSQSYSKLMAYESARILHRLGCDVRVYDPAGLPVKDGTSEGHAKVQELRDLSIWSDGHVWISPEQHGNVTAVFKNQIDWIPLTAGSVRPTQGRTLAIAQVSGGSQSFNTVNTLRILGRWMRMFVIPNQASLPKAYTQFAIEDGPESDGVYRMIPSSNRDRLVDCMEELVKYTLVMRPHLELFADRHSERKEKASKAKLAEEKKEAEQDAKINEEPKGDVNGVKLHSI